MNETELALQEVNRTVQDLTGDTTNQVKIEAAMLATAKFRDALDKELEAAFNAELGR